MTHAAWVKGASEDVEVWTRKHDVIEDGARSETSSRRRAYYRNIMTCGSAWECPSCMGRHRRQNEGKITTSVERWTHGYGDEPAHGCGSVYMLSLTVRHGLGDDLRTVRKGVTDAYSRMISGRAWEQFRGIPDRCLILGDLARAGREGTIPRYIQGSVRALEITHGALHGWHPHIHALIYCEVPPSEEMIAVMRAWYSEHWRAAVRQILGAEHEPDDVHGVDLRECHSANYISKMGLELSAPSTKVGRKANRAPIQIAIDYATTHDVADGKLWQDYCAGMHGAKALTWSGGFAARLGLSDEDEPTSDVEPQLVTAIDDITWRRVRDMRGAKLAILEAAESDGKAGVDRVLAELLSRAPPPRPWELTMPPSPRRLRLPC